jgi:hypothetical protein
MLSARAAKLTKSSTRRPGGFADSPESKGGLASRTSDRTEWSYAIEQSVMQSIHFVPLRDDFRSFSFLLIFLFRQVLGDFPNEND